MSSTNSKGLTRRNLLQFSAGVAGYASLGLRPSFAAGKSDYDVVVIGAGLAGLNAAINLQDLGFSVKVIEGSERVGGRLYTAPESEVPGHPEIGGNGIGSHYARIQYMAERFGVSLQGMRPRTEQEGDELLFHVNGKAIASSDWATHSDNPFLQTAYAARPLNLQQYMIYAKDNPLPKGDLSAWRDSAYADKDISVYDYLLKQGLSHEAIMLGFGKNMSYGVNPHDLSMMMGYQNDNLIRSLYSSQNATDVTIYSAKGGNQRVPEAMATGLKQEIAFNQRVEAIRSNETGVQVDTASGHRFFARYCISSLPMPALRVVDVAPGFSPLQSEAVQELDYTPVVQVHFKVKQPYWEKDKMAPSMWTDRICGRFMALKNDPADAEKVTSCVAFINGQYAEYLDRYSVEATAQLVLQDLEAIRPSLRGAIEVIKVFSWGRSPFAGGAYAYWKPGQINHFAKEMIKPCGRLHFAGEHTAVLNRGMEGAMESGERAALEIAELLS